MKITPSIGQRKQSKPATSGFHRIWHAARYSFKGLGSVWKREAAFRQEVYGAALLTIVTFFLTVTRYERCALLLSLAFVLVVELLNSAMEAVVDLLSPGFDPLAALAKDAGSAAVFVSLSIVAAVWVSILT